MRAPIPAPVHHPRTAHRHLLSGVPRVALAFAALACSALAGACDTNGASFTFATSPGSPTATGASLTALTLSSGTLNPAFASGTTAYTASVDNSVDAISVAASAAAGSTITVNGTPVASGAASPAIPLAEGANTVTVAVSNVDGESRTYTVTVTRQAGSP